MKSLGDILLVVASKAVKKGVVYLMDLGVPEVEIRECIHCLHPGRDLLCIYCQIDMGIDARGEVAQGIAYAVHIGHEVDIATGWPVRETIPCTNE